MKYTNNMLTYLKWRGDLSFGAAPLNMVDALIFTELVYLEFDDIVPGMEEEGVVTIAEAARRYREKYLQDMPEGAYNERQEFLLAVADTERFGPLELCNFVNDTDYEEEKQFAAVHIRLGEKQTFVSYRGTDSTLVGWKENFNMSYRMPVPAQRDALTYLKQTVKGAGKFYLGGHSKGGNLAVYAATFAPQKYQKKIEKIYTFDSPGFYSNLWECPEFEAVREKMDAYVPESSLVGMLLQHYGSYRVVKSSEYGFSQHNPLSWWVDGPRFSFAERRDHSSYFLEETVNAAIAKIPMEERKPFVDAFFAVLESTGIHSLSELSSMNLKKMAGIIRAMTTVSQENKDELIYILRLIREKLPEQIEE